LIGILCSRIALKHLEIVLFHFIAHRHTKYTTGLDLARVCQWPLLHNPSWVVHLPGPGSWGLNATENVQGRTLNGISPERVCCTAASHITQQFIHIEQHLEFHNPSEWIAPVIDTFP
jgi:hypothetical protein